MVLLAPPANACTLGHEVRGGQPAAGATEVPTDVVPWIWGDFGGGAQPRLVNASGAEVAVDLRQLAGDGHNWAVELAPLAPLAPNTRYALEHTRRIGTPQTTRIEFTTGAGPLGGAAPASPEVRGALAIRSESTSCSDDVIACVGTTGDGATGDGALEIGRTDASGTFVGSVMFSDADLANNPGYIQRNSAALPFCLQVRRRDLAGRRSAPVEVCTGSMPRTTTGAWHIVRCAGGTVNIPSPMARGDAGAGDTSTAPPEGGANCSVGAAPSRAVGIRPAQLALVAGLALLARRARRRR